MTLTSLQVKAPYNMLELRRRLVPFGAYVPVADVTSDELVQALRMHLHPDSLHEGQNFVQFLPLPVPYTSGTDLPERVFPMTVIDSQGRAKPITFGQTIEEVPFSALCM